MELDTICNMDCIEGMHDIPDGFIDLVIADPPYCVGTTSNGHKASWHDNNLVKPFFDLWFQEVRRVMKPNGEIYINTDWRTYPFLFPIMQKYFPVRNLIVWDYEWIKAGNWYRFSHEFIIYATHGGTNRKFSPVERDVWRIKPINFTSSSKLHNAQKPVELAGKMILNSSTKGDVVLDPFIGSGTTAIAAINLERHFIGFEIDEKYFEIAQRRIEQAMAQTKLEGL